MMHRAYLTKPPGFTLLEVLLALGLSTVVLFILTIAMHQFLTRTESGHGAVETSQLARALLNQMANDLRGVRVTGFTANPKTSAGDLEEENSNLSPLGLVGTATEVRIGQAASWYWESVPVTDSNADQAVPAEATQVAVHTVHPPETIRYFLREGDILSTDELAKMGIDTLDVDSIAGLCLERWPSAATRGDSEDSSANAKSTTSQTSHSPWVQLLAPEVIELAFSYADETGEFLDQWNSIEQGTLPKAVQIEMVMRKVPLTVSHGTQQDHIRSGHSNSRTSTTQRNVETYRLIVRLPNVQSPRAPTLQQVDYNPN